MFDEREKLIVGDFHSPPLMWRDSDNVPQGALISIAYAIAKYFNFDVVFEELTQKKLNLFANSGFDIGLGVFNCKSREAYGYFSSSILTYKIQALASLPGIIRFDELFARSDVRLAVKEGDIGYNLVCEKIGIDALSKLRVIVISDDSDNDLANTMAKRDSNVIICDSLTLYNIKKSLDFPTYYPFLKELGKVDMCLLVSKSSKLNISKIESWFFEENNRVLVRNHLRDIISQYPDCFIRKNNFLGS
jgi:hypothetical protein